MREFNPENMPEVTVIYTIVEWGQPQTLDQPGYDPEIEIGEVWIHGKAVSFEVNQALLTTYEEKWIKEIINDLSLGRAA